ncbi:unnamed protein product [Rhodiola kirilowii]
MTDRSSPESSLFCDLILSGRFDYHTLLVLESAMASKDIKSLSLSRSSVKSVLMSESVLAVQLFKHESLVKQLSILEFFVHAFSLAGDVEATSCLVMRYEALVLRELKSATCPWAQVTPDEWLTFVVQSLVSGFFSNAVKGCDYALSCLKKKDDENTSVVEKVVDNVEITRKVKKLRDMAISSASSCSVQAQAADYLRKKTQNNNNRKRQLPQHHTETQPLASDLFQNAIKKRHEERITELLKAGKDKRALKVARSKLGTHKRAKRKREEEMAGVLRNMRLLIEHNYNFLLVLETRRSDPSKFVCLFW